MLDHSFEFNGVDVRKDFGITVERFVDVLAPELRENSAEVPNRHGTVDFGARYYKNRAFRAECGTTRLLSRGDCRELAYVLSQKGEIYRWDEPDKHYVGRIYDPTEIDRVAGQLRKFNLIFVCEPFAYGKQITIDFKGSTRIDYPGTADAPTIITITNNTPVTVSGISLILRRRAD